MAQKLIHFNDAASNADVFSEIKQRGCRPASFWDLLDFKEHPLCFDPNLPVVALDTVVEMEPGEWFVPGLEFDGSDWQEVWCLYGPGWFPNYQFLAVI